MPKRSVIWKVAKEKLQTLLDDSETYKSVLHSLGMDSVSGGNYLTLKKRIKDDNLDTTKHKLNHKQWRGDKMKYASRKYEIDDIMVENSNYDRTSLKKRLIDECLLEYKCKRCGNIGEWDGEELTLQLEHKNGINNDNRIENLEFLCPNCHSLTSTFSGRNTKKKGYLCKNKDCDNSVCSNGSTLCVSCAGKAQRKFEINKDELEDLVINKKMTYVSIAKQYNVSDTSIRKRCLTLGISRPLRHKPNKMPSKKKLIKYRQIKGYTYKKIGEKFDRNEDWASYWCKKYDIKK